MKATVRRVPSRGPFESGGRGTPLIQLATVTSFHVTTSKVRTKRRLTGREPAVESFWPNRGEAKSSPPQDALRPVWARWPKLPGSRSLSIFQRIPVDAYSAAVSEHCLKRSAAPPGRRMQHATGSAPRHRGPASTFLGTATGESVSSPRSEATPRGFQKTDARRAPHPRRFRAVRGATTPGQEQTAFRSRRPLRDLLALCLPVGTAPHPQAVAVRQMQHAVVVPGPTSLEEGRQAFLIDCGAGACRTGGIGDHAACQPGG